MKKAKSMLINLRDKKVIIRPQIYGHFIEQAGRVVNDGMFVGKESTIPNRDGVRLDVIKGWKDMGCGMLHWPGGGVAEGYEWFKGVGERVADINKPFNGVDDPNEFGTHEFMDLCEHLECEAYIVAGVLCSNEKDLRDWIQYIVMDEPCRMERLRKENGRIEPWKLKYLCIGNEWWYEETARRYAEDFGRCKFIVDMFTGKPKNRPMLIARGPHIYDTEVTAELVAHLKPGTYDGMAFYIVAGDRGCSATDFTVEDYYHTLYTVQKTDGLIDTHIGIIRSDERNKNVRLCIDEWGTWYINEPEWYWKQTVTMRDTLAISQQLDIYNKHADVIETASLAMSVNALSSSMITEGEKFFRTPIYDVFRLYKNHQGAELLGSWLEAEKVTNGEEEINLLSHTASIKDGKIHITISNASVEESIEVNISFYGGKGENFVGEFVTGELHGVNSIDQPDAIRATEYTDFEVTDEGIKAVLPPLSLVALTGDIK